VFGFLIAASWDALVFGAIAELIRLEPQERGQADTVATLVSWLSSFWAFAVVAGFGGAVALWLQWRVHQVRMDDNVIEIKRGVLFRSSRRARLDRVNTIGVRRPLIPRLLGLAKLDIQAAGNDASVVLAYLPKATAEAVRREILEPSQASATGAVDPPQHVEREVDVPLFRYLGSLVVSIESVLFVIGVVATTVAAFQAQELVAWLGVIITLVVFVAFLADRFFRVGSFVVDTIDGDVRVSLGLLATSVETIPPARIHALQLSQPWPWRALGWWRLEANLASTPGASVSKAPSHTLLLPVATLEESLRVIAKCMPGLADTQSQATLVSALERRHDEWVEHEASLTASIGSPERARYRIPLSHTVNGAALRDDVVIMRTGVWIRKLSIIPLARVQSSSISVGPWHRALGLASFALQGVEGPVATGLLALERGALDGWWAELNRAVIRAISRSPQKTRLTKRGTS
jgi:putative membrane protein